MAKKEYDEIDKILDLQAFIESVEEGFKEVEDPRIKDNQAYPLLSLIIMILCAVIAGANSISDIHQYARLKVEMFSRLLGISTAPCYTTFWWLLTLMKPRPFQEAFFKWVESLSQEIKDKLIAIDGKHLNGLLRGDGVHLVSAWESSHGILLGQVKAEEKSNEITAIPKLLDMVDIKDATVTIDAAGCQTEITAKIRENGGDYVLALKGNQGTLHAEAKNFFIQAREVGFAEDTHVQSIEELEKGHGRIEEREVAVATHLDQWLNQEQLNKWKDLKSIIEVSLRRQTSQESRYFISSKDLSPQEALFFIRSHWSIENHLHWGMDVVFLEDASLANTKHAAENLSFFRRMAQALIQEDVGGKRGVAKRRRDAMWDDSYALRILGKLFRKSVKSFL